MAKREVNAARLCRETFCPRGGSRVLAGCLGGRNDGGAWGGQGRTLDGPSGLSFGLLRAGSGDRVGRLELRVPQDRDGRFSTALFERYQRSEKALLSALVEMYVQGVSTRKVKKITEELCGYRFSASTISNIVKRLDAQLLAFARRRLDEPFPYVIVDARYEKVRDNGVTGGADRARHRRRRAAPGAGGAGQPGKAHRRGRGFFSARSAACRASSSSSPTIKKAIAEVLPEAAWQRCYVHFLRNAACRENATTTACRNCAGSTTAAISAKTRWQGKYPTLTDVEDNIEETLAFYRLPRQHHKHLKSTNMLERYNQEIKRRTHIVRVFPNGERSARRRDPRGLARGQPLHQHETTDGAQTRADEAPPGQATCRPHAPHTKRLADLRHGAKIMMRLHQLPKRPSSSGRTISTTTSDRITDQPPNTREPCESRHSRAPEG